MIQANAEQPTELHHILKVPSSGGGLNCTPIKSDTKPEKKPMEKMIIIPAKA